MNKFTLQDLNKKKKTEELTKVERLIEKSEKMK